LVLVIGRRLVAAVTVVGALGVLGVSIAIGSTAPGPQPTSGSNRSRAQADAAARLAALNLPAGAQPSATEPAGGGPGLANPASGVGNQNVVDDHGWWVVPGSPSSVVAYVDAHPPTGSTHSLSGSGGSPQQVTVTGFSWPAITDVLGYRQLVVEAVTLPGDATGLRADSQVQWINPRPGSERIPAGVRRLTVSERQGHATVLAPLTVRSPSRLRRVIAVLDSLPVFPPGAYNCPADFGLAIHLAFYGGHGAPLAVALVDPDGCQGVGLKIRGQREPGLTGMDVPGSGLPSNFSLTRALGRALGVKFRTTVN
jgi:hypothetical protein